MIWRLNGIIFNFISLVFWYFCESTIATDSVGIWRYILTGGSLEIQYYLVLLANHFGGPGSIPSTGCSESEREIFAPVPGVA